MEASRSTISFVTAQENWMGIVTRVTSDGTVYGRCTPIVAFAIVHEADPLGNPLAAVNTTGVTPGDDRVQGHTVHKIAHDCELSMGWSERPRCAWALDEMATVRDARRPLVAVRGSLPAASASLG